MITKYIIAFVWGLAEATVFFIVPDVWLTIIFRKRIDNKLVSAIFLTTAGAICGGIIMYAFGRFLPDKTWNLLRLIPGINLQLLSKVQSQMLENGLLALASGPLQGIPYKIFAVNWGIVKGDLFLFCLISIPARSIRFVFSLIIVRTAFIVFEKKAKISNNTSLCIVLSFWVIFYFFYFYSL